MRRFFGRVLAGLGVLFLTLILGGAATFFALRPDRPAPPERIVLQLDWRSLPPHGPPASGLRAELLGEDRLDLVATLDLLGRAARDPAVAGIVADLGSAAGGGAATVQELRVAVAALRAAGKFAIAFSESLGETGDGLRAYHLATAFGEIWLQPSGEFGATGIAVRTPFLREALDRGGVEIAGGKRHEYKTAPNALVERGLTGPHRDDLQRLVDGLFGAFLADAARDRGVAPADLRAAIDRAPFGASEALAAKLVDRLAYRDEALDEAKRRAGAGAQAVSLRRYRGFAPQPPADAPVLAVVAGVGTILPGRDQGDPLGRARVMAAETVAEALLAAAADPAVKAILFRVDSPGGSYVASDTVDRAVRRAKAMGKPVVVAMGDVAASGGYMVALSADAIVARPATITGSIGVFAQWPVAETLLERLGVKVERVSVGANAGMFSPLERPSPEQAAALDRMLDRIYADFTRRVAEARGFDAARVDSVARGRVFVGEAARAAGLVDDVGGWPRAIAIAKERAGIAAGREVQLRPFPERKDRFERLLELVSGGRIARPTPLETALDDLRRALADNGLVLAPGGAVRMPPLPPLWD